MIRPRRSIQLLGGSKTAARGSRAAPDRRRSSDESSLSLSLFLSLYHVGWNIHCAKYITRLFFVDISQRLRAIYHVLTEDVHRKEEEGVKCGDKSNYACMRGKIDASRENGD